MASRHFKPPTLKNGPSNGRPKDHGVFFVPAQPQLRRNHTMVNPGRGGSNHAMMATAPTYQPRQQPEYRPRNVHEYPTRPRFVDRVPATASSSQPSTPASRRQQIVMPNVIDRRPPPKSWQPSELGGLLNLFKSSSNRNKAPEPRIAHSEIITRTYLDRQGRVVKYTESRVLR